MKIFLLFLIFNCVNYSVHAESLELNPNDILISPSMHGGASISYDGKNALLVWAIFPKFEVLNWIAEMELIKQKAISAGKMLVLDDRAKDFNYLSVSAKDISPAISIRNALGQTDPSVDQTNPPEMGIATQAN
jgi:hypothetical protein